MKLKKILCSILAIAMILSTMSFSVFAADGAITVNSKEEFQKALDEAVNGTIIQLSGGVDYGTVQIRPVSGQSNTVTNCDHNTVYKNEMLRTVENLTIIGAEDATVDCIELLHGNNENVWYYIDVKNLVIDGVTFTDKAAKGYSRNPSPLCFNLENVRVDGFTVKNCELTGDNANMNFVYAAGVKATNFETYLKNITISNNKVDGIARLCELRETVNVTISGNTVNNTVQHAVLLACNPDKTYSGNVVITDNTADGIGERMVRMAGAGNASVTVSGNNVVNYKGSSADFIKITDSKAECKIENNTLNGVNSVVESVNGEYKVTAVKVPTGTLTNAYTSGNTYWGECGGNASESFMFKLYNDDTYMGYTSLNNIDGIIDGDVYVSWHIKLDTASNTDEYWDMEWEIAPTVAMQPNRVEQWVDGSKVAECSVESNWSDRIFPVVAAVTENDGKIISYVNNTAGFTFANAVASGKNVVLLKDITLDNAVVIDNKLTLDLNGHELVYNSTVQGEAMITNKGDLTINDSVGDGVINYNYTGEADPNYGKGNYTISNAGKLTVNGGKITIANISNHAKYPIDNNSTTGDAVLVINGGHLYNYNTSAIRQFCNSTTYKNSVTINGGLIEGYSAIWMQNPGSKTVNGSLSVTGGEIRSTAKAWVNGTSKLEDTGSKIYCTTEGGAWSEDSSVSITGGTINENVYFIEEAPANIEIGKGVAFNGYVEAPAVDNSFVAKIGEVGYMTLAEAVANVKESETIAILAGTISEGTIKLPSTLKNVTFKGETGAILKDMTIMASDGNSFSYIGLTFDGITFENSRLIFTGWRTGDEIIENLTVTNCTFKNLYDDTNSACVHINKDVSEPVNGFTFTNNTIDGATGGKKSGIYTANTGNVVITGNTFNNIVFRPALVQLADCDGIADNVVISDNVISNTTRLQVYGKEEGPEEGPWTPVGTDTLEIAINDNIFKNITGQYICTWGINGEADITENYYDSTDLGGRIYWNNEAPTDEKGLAELGVYPVYTELNEDGTIDETSLYTPNFAAAFQTLTDGLILGETASISFNAFYTDFKNAEIEKYGMFIYGDKVNEKGIRLDSNEKPLTDGWFNAVVKNIPEENFESVIVMIPYVVIGEEPVYGDAVQAKVSDFID